MSNLISSTSFINLKGGNVFSNYKELCNFLDIPILTGNSKIAQEKELKRYVDFEKEGHKYIIKEVYDIPMPILSTKGSGYYETLEFIICRLLLNHISREGSTVYRTTINSLAENTGFVNNLYFEYLKHKNKLSAQLSVPVEVVEKLYKDSQRNYRGTIYRTLKKLEMDKVIKFQEVYYVQEIIEKDKIVLETDLDRFGDVQTHLYRPIEIEGDFRKATEFEIQTITDTEFKMLSRFNAENVYELYKNGNQVEYYNTVQRELINKIGIGKYYKVLEIYLVQEGIRKKERKLSEVLKELNDKFYQKLIKDENNSYKLVADQVIKLPSRL